MNLVRLDNVILVLVLSLGFEVYPSVVIYVCQIKGIDVAKMSFYRKLEKNPGISRAFVGLFPGFSAISRNL